MLLRHTGAIALVLVLAILRCGGNVVVDGSSAGSSGAGGTGANGTGGTGAGGGCPAGEYLIIPCCGGDNDTSCSHGGPPAPAPFCAQLSCDSTEAASCTPAADTCAGVVDPSARTVSCECI